MDGARAYEGGTAWDRALRALAILAVHPHALGGMWLRARSGPSRDRLLSRLPLLPLPIRRIGTSIPETQLFGELDLSGTLDRGFAVRQPGILEDEAALVLGSAERCPARLAAHLGEAMDRGTHVVVALDEGCDGADRPPQALLERLGLFVMLEGLSVANCASEVALPSREALCNARDRVATIAFPESAIAEIGKIAEWLGVTTMRAPLLTMAAARAAAALDGANEVDARHVAEAAALTLSHRGTPLPEEATEDTPPAEAQPDHAAAEDLHNEPGPQPPDELILDAVAAALPPGIVDQLTAPRPARGSTGMGAGAARRGNHRGRPQPARPGRPRSDARIDMVATLRAAAPWQGVRADPSKAARNLQVRGSDLRIRRFEETSDRVIIFAVDASGSLAMTRLAEAKGAVELLLSDAYSRRDHVALLAFRGDTAEVLLPPTRSLVQTKRRLQALPGGGGTPLAAGLKMALECADRATRQGMSPTIVLLTDGRANITLDGRADRTAAGEDTANIARIIRARGVPVLTIDTSPRPQPALGKIADLLGGRYFALPRADSRRLSDAVSSALED